MIYDRQSLSHELIAAATIPHHHPFLDRSLTFPESVMCRLSEDGNEKPPRISDFPKPNVGNPSKSYQVRTGTGKLDRTIASTTSQKDHTPLFITAKAEPSNSMCSSVCDTADDKPPKVPPKSPRTESRASPRVKQLPHSASSSTSTTHSACSSATSVSSSVGKFSPKPRMNSYTSETPQNQLGILEKPEVKPSGNPFRSPEKLERRTPPRAESPVNPQSGPYKSGPWAGLDQIGRKSPPRVNSPSIQNHESNNAEPSSQLTGPASTDTYLSSGVTNNRERPIDDMGSMQPVDGSKRHAHQRDVSEASLIDRGRPTKRGDTTLIGALAKPKLMNLKLTEDSIELPSGVIAREAFKIMPNSDLELLKQEAEMKADSFEVLSTKDVSNLSKASQSHWRRG